MEQSERVRLNKKKKKREKIYTRQAKAYVKINRNEIWTISFVQL